MRFTPDQLNKKRGRRKVNKPKDQKNASPALALFCKNDDFLMKPAYVKEERTNRQYLIYICPRCNNIINPSFQKAQHGMIVQTADNAIRYQGKRATIATNKMRSFQDKKEDPLQKFLDDKIPGIHENPYMKITKRTIQLKGKKDMRIKVYE